MTKGQSLFLFVIILLILITITLEVFVNIVRRKLMFVRHKLGAPCEDPLNKGRMLPALFPVVLSDF